MAKIIITIILVNIEIKIIYLAINRQKSSLLQTQLITYVAVHMVSTTMRAELSPARLEALNSLLSPLHLTNW